MAKVIGVGGVFFLCKDTDATKAWYQEVLGLEPTEFGGFAFKQADAAATFPKGAMTIFAPFSDDSDYFKPSEKSMMFNLMVDDLDGILERVKSAGVELTQPSESYDYGKFAWLMDPDGRKIELWEPIEPKS
jgi:predicted enzyme related to lactoylglutathione lyase